MIGQQMDTLDSVFQRLKAFSELLGQESAQVPEEDPAFLEQTEAALRCSASMSLRFRQLVRYACSAGIAYREILERYVQEGLLPVTGRKEGKDLLAQFDIPSVPIIDENFITPKTVDEILAIATDKSAIDGGMREGLVFRSADGVQSFKAVSNEFLVKYHQG